MTILIFIAAGNLSPVDLLSLSLRNDRSSGAPFVFMTAYSGLTSRQKAEPLGSAFVNHSLAFRCLMPLSAMSWRYCTPCQWILETPS